MKLYNGHTAARLCRTISICWMDSHCDCWSWNSTWKERISQATDWHKCDWWRLYIEFRIKFRYLLFESGGIYNNEKLNPVLFYNNIILLAKMIMLSFASLFSWIWSQELMWFQRSYNVV